MVAHSHPSFSTARRVRIGLNLLLRTGIVLAVVAMAVHLSGRYFHRGYLSANTRVELSPRTVSFLKALTNETRVLLYFDKEHELYSSLNALLKEFRNLNPHLAVSTVDYTRDTAEASRIKAEFRIPSATDQSERNYVLFACEGRKMKVRGDALADYTSELSVNEKGERVLNRRMVAQKGEMVFTSFLLAVTSSKPLKACFLQGHGEHRIDDADDVTGYREFATLLVQNSILVESIHLHGTNDIPDDCNLLIIAGPTKEIPGPELEKIGAFLDQGRRLLALINPYARAGHTGLERILVRWNVMVGDSEVRDPVNTTMKGADLLVFKFSDHAVVNALHRNALHMVLPRPVKALAAGGSGPDAPRVHEVAFSGEQAFLAGDPKREARRQPVIAVVEKGAPPGVATERGTTRIVVTGDSTFLGNQMIKSAANLDFADNAVNWLLDRTHLFGGVGPRPVREFRISMTRSQMRTTRWLLLGVVPGAVLALGGLVWLRRRK